MNLKYAHINPLKNICIHNPKPGSSLPSNLLSAVQFFWADLTVNVTLILIETFFFENNRFVAERRNCLDCKYLSY